MKKRYLIILILILVIAIAFMIMQKVSKFNALSNYSNSTNIESKKEALKPKVVVYDESKYKENLPVYDILVRYVHDTSTPEKSAGIASYVFIGKVNNIIRTEYKFPVESVVDGERVIVYDPYTVYSVSVIENIKGNLIKTKDIEMVQQGGLDENMKSYSFVRGMGYLELGKYYIFLPYAQSEGTIGINSTTSVIPLEITDENSTQVIEEAKNYANKIIENNLNLENRKPDTTQMEIIAKYILAVRNQVVPEDVETIKSKLYDEEYAK